MKIPFISKLALLTGVTILTTVLLNAQTTTYYGDSTGTVGINNSFFGYQAGKVTTQRGNTFIGAYAGKLNITGQYNVFNGYSAGYKNTSGLGNIFIGASSGYNNTSGNGNIFLGLNAGFYNTTAAYNVFLGSNTGYNTTTGDYNMFIGAEAGRSNTTGKGNVFVGYSTGFSNITGANNVFIGYNTGYINDGTENVFIGTNAGSENEAGLGNVFIGNQAGQHEMGSNKLYIANSDTTSPLIFGNFATNQIGINTNILATGYVLSVNGGIIADELKIQAFANWPDYVFRDGYKLMPLKELEKYIKVNGHLPNVASAKEVAENGFTISEMNAKLLEKTEVLTLYLIEQSKEVVDLKKRIEELEKK